MRSLAWASVQEFPPEVAVGTMLAGRPCEIDVINGAIPRLAHELGLAAPVNETVTALVKAKNGFS